jgi:enoyl-CoA hydratase/carnithine racemase
MLSIEISAGTAWLKIDRPEKMNAMPRAFWPELVAAVEAVGDDEAVRVVVFHGAGRCFSVGGDIEDFGRIGDEDDRRAYMAEALGAFRAVDELPKPVIAAVHGAAFGGGCELTMVCDVVIADESARFGTPEAGVGLVPGVGIVRGRAHLNLHWMKYMVLSGLPLDAEQARLAGLVNFVVPEGEHLVEAGRMAEVMRGRSSVAQAVGKAFLGKGGWADEARAAEVVVGLQGDDDFREGIAAFAARRPPRFDQTTIDAGRKED